MRGRRIRFKGGVLDGVQVVPMPLPPEYAAARPAKYEWWKLALPLPDRSPEIDHYVLVKCIDGTGIPEMQYHLRNQTYYTRVLPVFEPPLWAYLKREELTYEPSEA